MDIWRSNFVSIYFNTDVIGECRQTVINIFDGLMDLYHLECVVKTDNLLTGIPGVEVPSFSTGIVDNIYIRSTPETLVTWAQFSKIVSSIFGILLLDKEREWIVSPQLRKYLRRDPFPRN